MHFYSFFATRGVAPCWPLKKNTHPHQVHFYDLEATLVFSTIYGFTYVYEVCQLHVTCQDVQKKTKKKSFLEPYPEVRHFNISMKCLTQLAISRFYAVVYSTKTISQIGFTLGQFNLKMFAVLIYKAFGFSCNILANFDVSPQHKKQLNSQIVQSSPNFVVFEACGRKHL